MKLLCEHCGEQPKADQVDDLGRPVSLCEDCLSTQGELQQAMRQEA
jgi:hypothetical protein